MYRLVEYNWKDGHRYFLGCADSADALPWEDCARCRTYCILLADNTPIMQFEGSNACEVRKWCNENPGWSGSIIWEGKDFDYDDY